MCKISVCQPLLFKSFPQNRCVQTSEMKVLSSTGKRGTSFFPPHRVFLSPSEADVGVPPLSFTPQCWQMGQTVGLWCQWVGTAAEVRTNGRKEKDLTGRHDNSSIGNHLLTQKISFFKCIFMFQGIRATLLQKLRCIRCLWPLSDTCRFFFFNKMKSFH